MVLLQKRFDLFPLVRGEFQVLCQMIEFLIDRPRAVDQRDCLIRPPLLSTARLYTGVITISCLGMLSSIDIPTPKC
jgi:hypothetical protein